MLPMRSIPFLVLVFFFFANCDEDSDCEKLKYKSVYGKMYTVAISGMPAIIRLIDTQSYRGGYKKGDVKRDLIRFFETYLNREIGNAESEGEVMYLYFKAAAALSPFIVEGDLDDLVEFKRNFHVEYQDLLLQYLLFTKYKFYCKLDHNERKELIKSIETRDDVWHNYKQWKHVYNNLYKAYVKTNKRKPENDPIYKSTIEFIHYCIDIYSQYGGY